MKRTIHVPLHSMCLKRHECQFVTCVNGFSFFVLAFCFTGPEVTVHDKRAVGSHHEADALYVLTYKSVQMLLFKFKNKLTDAILRELS
jgi:hypothetical protein